MSKKTNTDFTATQTAEEFFNYIQTKVKNGKLSGVNRYEIRKIMEDASRQCDVNLVKYIAEFLKEN